MTSDFDKLKDEAEKEVQQHPQQVKEGEQAAEKEGKEFAEKEWRRNSVASTAMTVRLAGSSARTRVARGSKPTST